MRRRLGGLCVLSASKAPAMRRPWPSTTPTGACCRTDCTARLQCTKPMGGRAGTRLPGPCPAAYCRWCGRRCAAPPRPGVDRRGGLYGGPGLIGALLVGAGFARSLAYAWGSRPSGIHHLEGHLLAPLLEPDPPAFPFLALLVSGGHTQLVDVAGLGRYRILGETLDDAAGEAFDKTAKLLGLPYPGGAALAQAGRARPRRPLRVPAADARSPGPRFQFQWLEDRRPSSLAGPRFGRRRSERTSRAVSRKQWSRRSPRNAGARSSDGSSAAGRGRRRGRQSALRERLARRARCGAELYFPRAEFCTDNGAMIALAGCMRLAAGMRDASAIGARANWELGTDLTGG
jgi:N6-L-threonylcarbamoyladenine synthase